MRDEKSRLVYSTERTVDRKEKPCEKVSRPAQPAAGQKLTVRLERKGRRGKAVTIIEGLMLPQEKIEELLRQLKSGLGTGGTVRGAALEIQGDHRDVVMATMKDMGYC